jgi:hypothetical protein
MLQHFRIINNIAAQVQEKSGIRKKNPGIIKKYKALFLRHYMADGN